MCEGFIVSALVVSAESFSCGAVAPPEALFFDGHFPGDPVLPAAAQLSMLVEPMALRAWPELGSLQRATNLKFHRVSRPGEALTLSAERDGARVRFTIHHGAELVSAGTLDFRGPKPHAR